MKRTEPVREALAIFQAALALIGIVASGFPASAQVTPEAERNVSRQANYQNECAIKVNPTNANQVVAACNNALGGIFFARSTDRGNTWVFPDADRTIADGDPGQGNLACCDPNLAWDSFGNLYITYLGNMGAIETLLSTDAGLTFTVLATFPGNNDQPSIVAENTTAPGAPVAVWIVWNNGTSMVARGAAATALGTVGPFGATQNIPGTNNCSFGDVAVSPNGAVVQVCQTPTGGQGPANILVNVDADGLGPGNFGAAITATTTNVGGFDRIPAQNVRSVDAEAGLAFDRNPLSARFGRLYLVYTEEVVNESNDTDIMARFSDAPFTTWSAPIRVNDDPAAPVRSQFNPKISSNSLSGNIAVCWHDARNSAANNQTQVFCSLSTPTATPTFFANVQVSAGASQGTGSSPPVPGQLDIQYGDYSGLDYFQGRFHPIWADQSNSTGDNPDGTTRWDAYTNRVGGGMAANEGDPHIRTMDGTNYDFQAAGEFVSLKGADGFELQVRQTAIATTFFPGPNPHTDLATCVSVNSAVAARVGKHRVTYQPRLDGEPDASGMQLRIDGVHSALTEAGIALPGGGRVLRSVVGGMEIELPSGAVIVATPGWWASQGKWYLNVNAYGIDAYDGIMGAISRGGWLPALPDGLSLGPKPVSPTQRYNDLYKKFADAWRVSDKSSLFDYAPGTSTATFTLPGWPKDSPPCELPREKQAVPAQQKVAEAACRPIRNRNRRQNCMFDVVATGETGFARTYQLTERLEQWGTAIQLTLGPQTPGTKPLVFVATVSRKLTPGKAPPGFVQFLLFGQPHGRPVPIDKLGQASWSAKELDPSHYVVAARYIPPKDSEYLVGMSAELVFPDRSSLTENYFKPAKK
jgi:hypothetical protein